MPNPVRQTRREKPVENFMESAQSETMRRNMIDSQLRTNGVNEGWILAAMMAVPREDFVPAEHKAVAYMDRAIALGQGNMLNPPLTAGQLLTGAEVKADDTILLVGPATGYLAALLRNNGLAAQAVEAEATGEGPFSLIIVDGAIEMLPDALVAELAEGGRIVTGLAEGPATRLAIGYKHGGHVRLKPFADLEVAPLLGFAKPKEFVF
jgi:protein-L-isoaspartate(D-aspartate) O-methyltransferase